VYDFSIKVGRKEVNANVFLLKKCSSLDYLLESIAMLEKTLNTTLVIVRKELAPFKRFLQIACTNALTSFAEKKGIAKKLSIEILLNMAGIRQIRDAIKILVPLNEPEALLIVLSEDRNEILKAVERVKELAECAEIDGEAPASQALLKKIIELYSIPEAEIQATYAKDVLEALEKCLISRSAMLYITK